LPELNGTPLPIKLEKEKAKESKKSKLDKYAAEEVICALRQNLSQPGKLITVRSSSG